MYTVRQCNKHGIECWCVYRIVDGVHMYVTQFASQWQAKRRAAELICRAGQV